MTNTILNQFRDAIAVTRNSKYLDGTSNLPFSVTLVFGDFRREYEMESFDKACNVANSMSIDYHINYTLEEGIDPEYDEYWYK